MLEKNKKNKINKKTKTDDGQTNINDGRTAYRILKIEVVHLQNTIYQSIRVFSTKARNKLFEEYRKPNDKLIFKLIG